MPKLHRHIVSLAVAVAGLMASGGASAQTWDLDACVVSSACSDAANSSTVSITGWYANADQKFYQGTITNSGTDWVGVRSSNLSGNWESTAGDSAWNHAIDNSGTAGATFAEGALLSFTQAVDISSIAASYVVSSTWGRGEFQLWRWDGGSGAAFSTVTDSLTGTMTGWTSVTTTNGDFARNKTQAVSDGATFSSYWLVTTKFTGGSNDAFKLGKVSAVGACASGTNGDSSGGCSSTTTSIPEPASLALFCIAGLAAGAARRRARTSRA